MKTRIILALLGLLAFRESSIYAAYSIGDKGMWPESWPKALEPLRKQATTLDGPRGQFYLIPFIKREELESAWPYFWKVKSKGAPIILVRSPKTVFPELKVGVLIHCPPAGTDKGAHPEKPIDDWERFGDVRARWMWTTYIELVVDGNVVDLNRIPLPADTPIIDERFSPGSVKKADAGNERAIQALDATAPDPKSEHEGLASSTDKPFERDSTSGALETYPEVSKKESGPETPPASLERPDKPSSGASTVHPVGGELLPEDSLSARYWQGLDPIGKTVFLTGYRHGLGPSEDGAAKREFRVLSANHFATLITKLDKFYQISDNRQVFISAAIQICFMEMAGKAQADIDQAVKQAREAPSQL